jgi:phosphoglycolate phosphatase-like HAD superfamily hydrolase
LLKDARHALRELKKSGFKIGLVSNSGRKGIKLALEKFDIHWVFDVVITRDDVQRIKPSGDCIKKALSVLGCDPGEAAYVGDSWVDVMAARDADVMAFALVGGMSPKEKLLQARPDMIISSLGELLKIVQKKVKRWPSFSSHRSVSGSTKNEVWAQDHVKAVLSTIFCRIHSRMQFRPNSF